MHLEGQTEFGDIPWTREGSTGMSLDSAQSLAHRIGMTDKHFGGAAHRRGVHRVTLDEPIEADPDAAEDNLGDLIVQSPWGRGRGCRR